MGIRLRHQDPVMPGAAAVPAAKTSHGARLPRTVRTGPWPRFAVAGVVLAVIGVTLTDWTDCTGLGRPIRTPGRTLTCDSGLRSTGRTGSIDLRVRWPGPCTLHAQ